MTATINYLFEANIVLLLSLSFYLLVLRHETSFRLMRLYLLASIVAGLCFPLVDLPLGAASDPLSISRVVPSYWLPEVIVGSDSVKSEANSTLNVWRIISGVYVCGLIIGVTAVTLQLIQLFRLYRRSSTYRLGKLHVAESVESRPTFSFFNFIFVGNADSLTVAEKEQIIRHETVHAKQWHSLDILLVNILRVVFWFNPFINTYKKIFIQLHEFEADARAVEDRDVDKYCNLLARVALQSADFTLANHFNNSLTVKRIEMMRTIKRNIKQWKVAALGMVLALVFAFVACQDQVGDDIMEIAQNSTHALIVPEHIQARYEQLKRENPQKNYALLELNETASSRLEELKDEYGLPKHIEVFNGADEKLEAQTGVLRMLSETEQSSYSEFTVTEADSKKAGHTYAIIEFTDQTRKITTMSGDDNIFTVVEEQPQFPGGYDSMIVFLQRNLRYPLEARQQGIEGTVYTSFIVEKDGSVTDVKTIRGISDDANAEAARVIQLFPNWIPGKQSGEQVRVRFVLPIKFKL